MENQSKTMSNCRDQEGITVGLIDALIAIARVLAKRDFDSEVVKEALKDLADDEDVCHIIDSAKIVAKKK